MGLVRFIDVGTNGGIYYVYLFITFILYSLDSFLLRLERLYPKEVLASIMAKLIFFINTMLLLYLINFH
jgi:hypothetical protein